MVYKVKRFSLYTTMAGSNENVKANDSIMKQDFKNGNYLKGIKHGLYVSKSTREKYKNGTY